MKVTSGEADDVGVEEKGSGSTGGSVWLVNGGREVFDFGCFFGCLVFF